MALGLSRESEPDFQVETSHVYGKVKLKMKRDSGEVISLERPRVGSEIQVCYRPGLVCVYGYDGALRRVSYRLKEYMEGAKLPVHMQTLTKFMKKCRAEMLVSANIKGNWFQVRMERGKDTASLASFKLSEVLGRGFDFNVEIARERSLQLGTRIRKIEDNYWIGVGAVGALYESPVLEKIDTLLLTEPVTKEKIEEMLAVAGGRMVYVM